MKPILPLLCLAAMTNVSFAALDQGVDEYRQGRYFSATSAFSKLSKVDPVEAYYLGRMNLYGYGQLKNNVKALNYFTQSAEGGFLPAQAIMARYSLLVNHDFGRAFYWFKKSADANDIQSQLYCAAAYLFGLGVPKNEDKARQYYIGAAKQGSAIAQAALADQFINSRQSGNKQLGLIWLNKAVAQGDPAAQLLLAKLMASGKDVPKTSENATHLIEQALAAGYAPAMVYKGDLAISEKDFARAKDWYTQAANEGYKPAELALARFYFDERNPERDPHVGYLWVLKAAQANYPEAQLWLANMYKEGKFVEANPELAKAWRARAVKDATLGAESAVIQWLSNGKAKNFVGSGYSLRGIFTEWANPSATKENGYNPAPQMVNLTRDALYKPNFTLVKPNEISISDYYDALAVAMGNEKKGSDRFISYPYDEDVTAIKAASDAKDEVKAKSLVDQLSYEASLGNSQAQFDFAQVLQYGLGVKADPQSAIRYYTQAASMEYVPAMYALGELYLNGSGGDLKPDVITGLKWLREAAFKGNTHAQYALAHLYEEGLKDDAGKVVMPADAQQAEGMYFLASADGNGPAQYRLAERLVRKKQDEASVEAKQARQALIKSLYQEAESHGVQAAALPLAFFNAMDADAKKQLDAFNVAKKEADAGNEQAALLVGLQYDRGLGVQANHREAMHWYQRSGSNPVAAFILGTYYNADSESAGEKTKGMDLLKKAAADNFSYAHLNVAVLEQQQGGDFLPSLRKALAAGNSKAGLLLADYYLSKASDASEMKESHDIYRLFAEKGDKDAQLKLAYLYEKGLGVAVNEEIALQWYQRSAEQSQVVAQYLLGHFYQMGYLNGQPDYALAKEWYARAQSTYSPAAVALGFLYETVDDDYKQAEASYAIAANLHEAIGLYNQGLIYEEGKGREVDFEKAQQFYNQATEKGLSSAMVRLAGLYFNGQGVAKDEREAVRLYKEAAEKGDRQALYQLGLLSETGVAVKLDFDKALEYYNQSAKVGDQQAMLALARMYQFGIGVPQDMQKAVMAYQTLVDLGNGFAQYQLATLYHNHVIAEKRIGDSKKWLEMARQNGSLQAANVLERLAAENQSQQSYVMPIQLNQASLSTELPVELQYLHALNQWNSGNEMYAKMMLDRIRTQFPDYRPVKKLYEQMQMG